MQSAPTTRPRVLDGWAGEVVRSWLSPRPRRGHEGRQRAPDPLEPEHPVGGALRCHVDCRRRRDRYPFPHARLTMLRASRERGPIRRDGQLIVEDAHAFPSAEVLWRRHSTRREGSGQDLDDLVTAVILTNGELLEMRHYGKGTVTRNAARRWRGMETGSA